MLKEKINRVAKRATMQENIYGALRRSLMQGQFQPGSALTIHSLAEAFGSSTMPVREALRQLAAENGLEALPNGTIQVPQVSLERLRDLTRFRLQLEGEATEMACDNVDDALLRRLKRVIGEHELAIKHDGVYPSLEKNQEFHFIIYEASGSAVLPRLIETLWLQYGPYMRVISEHVENNPTAEFQKNGTDIHHGVVEALEKRDAKAARTAMEADIQRTFDMLLNFMGSELQAS